MISLLKVRLFFFSPAALEETDLEEMAMHETEDNKVFQWFKKKIAPEPHQVIKKRIQYHISNVCVRLMLF